MIPDPAPLSRPNIDPTILFDMVRWGMGSDLLTAALAHFKLFEILAEKPRSFEDLRAILGLAPRPGNVLIVAMRAMGLIVAEAGGLLALSPIAREHFDPAAEFYMGGYVALTAETPGVKNIVQRLRSNKPIEHAPDDPGVGFLFREGIESAMDHEAPARRLTLALAGRARIVAPVLAEVCPLREHDRLLDIGGGTGLYAIAMLRANPASRAVVWDRAEVLKVASEMAHKHAVADRLELTPGDMFADPFPPGCNVHLLSNILHDWDIPECQRLLRRCAESLPAGGRVLIHDVFLNDALDGPLPAALYSAALFNVTEGRLYSAAEYRQMLSEAGLRPGRVAATAVNCSVMEATKL